MSEHSKSIVVIPTYDEADNIQTVIDRVRHAAPEVDVLVVDDNSPDGTAAIVESHPDYLDHVFLLRHGEKAGLGAAYRAGFHWALNWHYDLIVQMDADLSHPPERVPAMITALEDADVAIGSRYVPGGGTSDWPWRRRLISRAGHTYVRLVLRLPVQDTTAGFKAFRRSALEQIGATEAASEGYCFQIENTWRAARLGLRLTEVPITFTDRIHGTSKMSSAIVAEAVRRVLWWRWQETHKALARGLTQPRTTHAVT
jgi:dolichol-phosphate mannosyltransferase